MLRTACCLAAAVLFLASDVRAMSLDEFLSLTDTGARQRIAQSLITDDPATHTIVTRFIDENMQAFHELRALYPTMSSQEKGLFEAMLYRYDNVYLYVLYFYKEYRRLALIKYQKGLR